MDERKFEKRPLGRTGILVSTMGIGGAWLGHRGDLQYDEDTAVATVLRGLESGMNYIDTSGAYIDGESERFIGIALQEWFSHGNRRENLVISSKTGSRVQPHNYSYDFTMQSADTSLGLLGVDYVDFMLIHDPDNLDQVLSKNGAVVALEKLKHEGTIKAIGIGCRNHEHHRKCINHGSFDMCLTFKDYNLGSQTAFPSVMKPAAEKGVGIVNASITVNGFLGGPDPYLSPGYDPRSSRADTIAAADRAKALWDWCRNREIDIASLNLQYCLRSPYIASTVIGFSRPERVDQNVEAYFTSFNEELWDELITEFGISQGQP